MDIDNPSSTPSTAILAPFNLSDVSLRLEAATYQKELARIWAYFAVNSPRNNLKLSLGDTPGDTPQRVIADIIQPYASHLTSLDLHIDIDVVENLLRLPAGTFPQLQSLRLSVVHRVHTGWLLFRPEGDPTRTDMLALAPRLSSFEFDHGTAPYFTDQELKEYAECRCTFYPPQIGFNFTELTHLVLSVELPCVVAHELLRRCTVLRVCTLVVRTEGDYDAAVLKGIPLPALTSLSVAFDSYTAACAFWQRLFIPAVKNLDHFGSYSAALIDCLRRSEAKLLALHLQGVTALDGQEFTNLVSPQTDLTDLDLTDCKGQFWGVLAQRPPVHLPALQRFVYNNMDTWDVGSIIAFIDARTDPRFVNGAVVPLKTVSLLGSTYRHAGNESDCPAASTLRRLVAKMAQWKAQAAGLHVDLSLRSRAPIQCEYCSGEPTLYKTIEEGRLAYRADDSTVAASVPVDNNAPTIRNDVRPVLNPAASFRPPSPAPRFNFFPPAGAFNWERRRTPPPVATLPRAHDSTIAISVPVDNNSSTSNDVRPVLNPAASLRPPSPAPRFNSFPPARGSYERRWPVATFSPWPTDLTQTWHKSGLERMPITETLEQEDIEFWAWDEVDEQFVLSIH